VILPTHLATLGDIAKSLGNVAMSLGDIAESLGNRKTGLLVMRPSRSISVALSLGKRDQCG
jgi:hypothetical protein